MNNFLLLFAGLVLLCPATITGQEVVKNRLWTPESQLNIAGCTPVNIASNKLGSAIIAECTNGFTLFWYDGKNLIKILANGDEKLNGTLIAYWYKGSIALRPMRGGMSKNALYFTTSTRFDPDTKAAIRVMSWKYAGFKELQKLYEMGQQITIPAGNNNITGTLVSVDGPYPGYNGREAVILDVRVGSTRYAGLYERSADGSLRQIFMDLIAAINPVLDKSGNVIYKKLIPPNVFELMLFNPTSNRSSVLVGKNTGGENITDCCDVILNENYDILTNYIVANTFGRVAIIDQSSIKNVIKIEDLLSANWKGGRVMDFAENKIIIIVGRKDIPTTNGNLALVTLDMSTKIVEIFAYAGQDVFQGQTLGGVNSLMAQFTTSPGDVIFAETDSQGKWLRWIKGQQPLIKSFPVLAEVGSSIKLTGNNFVINGTRTTFKVNETERSFSYMAPNELEFFTIPEDASNRFINVKVELDHTTGIIVSNTVVIEINNAQPAIVINAVTDTATNTNSIKEGLAPNQIITLWGTFPAIGVIEICGTQAPILYWDNNQINTVVPIECADVAKATIQVINGSASNILQADIKSAKPGVFMVGNLPAITDKNDNLLTEKNPAKAGDVIVIYCNGLGLTQPPVPTGTNSPYDPLAKILIPLRVWIKQGDAYWFPDVIFAGLTPGLVGLYQINLSLPADLPAGLWELTIEAGRDNVSPTVKFIVN